ncbi:MAG: conjugal transfer protein TraN [Pseudomonadota bacterium]
MHDRHARSLLIGAGIAVAFNLTLGVAPQARAQLMCSIDVTGDGDFDDPGETATCANADFCPLDKVACVSPTPVFVCPSPGAVEDHCHATGGFCEYPNPSDPVDTIVAMCIPNPAPPTPPACPMTGGGACVDDGTGALFCSAVPCVDIGARGGAVDASRPREYVIDDGTRDAAGACLDQMRIFSGFPMDCRPPGARTLFQDCCKNRGQIITDDGGSGLGAAGTIAGFNAVFSGMSAAYSAFTAGASVGGAASAGVAGIVSAFSPVTLAGAALIGLITDLLNLGCDAQDMETGVLRGSGMCHEIEDYCAVRLPLIGCIQKKTAHCCFNSKLGRIIQEQGRPQLAAFTALPALWGTADSPVCRGFTPEEFQALDFSSMDLSEYYAELTLNAEAVMQTTVEEAINDYTSTNGVN